MSQKKTSRAGIPLKKWHGQYFLHDVDVVHTMLDAVRVHQASIIEIGCGDGFLTEKLLQNNPDRLWVFEIDPQWAAYVKKKCHDTRLTIIVEDVLKADFGELVPDQPWILCANLPYHITFPLLYKIQEFRNVLSEGVIMVQEEVAQKIVKTGGRGYGYTSLFFQYYFDWTLLCKVSPTSFYPKPKIYSRLLHFKIKQNIQAISKEERFWTFIKCCFSQPRRTLKNNLMQTHWSWHTLDKDRLEKRAQELTIADFFEMWKKVSVDKIAEN